MSFLLFIGIFMKIIAQLHFSFVYCETSMHTDFYLGIVPISYVSDNPNMIFILIESKYL